MKTRHATRIETLESRIAPAVTIVNAHTATYTDIDGDHVTVTVSTGTLTAANFVLYEDAFAGGEGLKVLDLHSGGFDGANVTVKVDPVSGGSGLANVGFIDSTGHDLGNVKVAGDLGRIDAGDNTGSTPAIKLLAVRSMGQVGLDSQDLSGNLESDIHGDINSMIVQGNMVGTYFNVVGFGFGGVFHANIASLNIGGSLIGTKDDHGGELSTFGHITNAKIRGDVRGGDGLNSGSLSIPGAGSHVEIGGSLIGGKGEGSGSLSGYNATPSITVGHNLIGGSGISSGSIHGFFRIGKVTVGGSLLGGEGEKSGSVAAEDSGIGVVKIVYDVRGGSGRDSGNVVDYAGGLIAIGGSLVGGAGYVSGNVTGFVKAITIGGDFIGGNVEGSASLDHSGYIIIGRSDTSSTLVINGSIIAGVDNSAGPLTNSAGIFSEGEVAVIVKGSVIGHLDTGHGESRVRMVGRGGAVSTPFSRIGVGGDVQYTDILGGFFLDADTAVPESFHVKVGPVFVGGDWTGSNLVVGAQNLGGDGAPGGIGGYEDNRDFGNNNDSVSPDSHPGDNVKAEITSITILGQVLRTMSPAGDHFGFVSEKIGPVKIGGQTIAVPTNTTPKTILNSFDTTIHIVAPVT